MLYLYDCESPSAEKIMVRVLGSLVTEQMYLEKGNLKRKETYTWDIQDGRVLSCAGPTGSIVIVPPELGKLYPVECIGSNAFIKVEPSLVVLLGTGRVTLERDAFKNVGLVKANAWLKRSEIPDNVRPLGRVLEDVRS